MRLGKIQAAGYIEDTEAVAGADAEQLAAPGRILTSDPEPVISVVAVG